MSIYSERIASKVVESIAHWSECIAFGLITGLNSKLDQSTGLRSLS